jgi:hypothetical protein
MIDFSTTPFIGGAMPPPGTNPQPGLPPSGSPFYQLPNPLQGVEEWAMGAALGLGLPLFAPFLLVFIVLLIVVAVVLGLGGFTMGLIMGDDS